MLPDNDLQLLTAFVDGEVTPRERKKVATLLQKSPTAQLVLERLQADARRIRDLTRLKLGPDFPDKVMRTIAQSGIRPPRARPPAPAPSPWIGMAVAASLFLMIAAASYWYFSPRRDIAPRHPDAVAARALKGFFGDFSAGAMHIAAGDLGAETTRAALATTLHKDSAYHVDLTVQDNRRAIERVAATLKHSGVQVLMSAAVSENVKPKNGKATYFVFADNLTPGELANLLQQLGKPAAKVDEAGINRVIIDAMSLEHRQQLATLLGMAPGEGHPGEARDPLGELVDKKIIARDPPGQEAAPITSRAPTGERFALVLVSPRGDLTALGDSPELRTFLSRSRERQPGTLRVFLVIHESNA